MSERISLSTTKRILSYVKEYNEYSSSVCIGEDASLTSYVDSDWEGDQNERTITTGDAFVLV